MRVDCIFCGFESYGVDGLKAHSATCNLHPLAAERDQLRAQLEVASGNARLYADKCVALEAEVERLRREVAVICRITQGNAADLAKPVDTVAEYVTEARGRINAAIARAEAAESTVAGLRRALEEVRIRAAFIGHPGEAFYDRGDGVMVPDWRDVLQQLEAALAASPAEHERRIKAESLRSTAAELEVLRDYIQAEVGPDDARDDIRRICWNRAKNLRDEADRLEWGSH